MLSLFSIDTTIVIVLSYSRYGSQWCKCVRIAIWDMINIERARKEDEIFLAGGQQSLQIMSLLLGVCHCEECRGVRKKCMPGLLVCLRLLSFPKLGTLAL